MNQMHHPDLVTTDLNEGLLTLTLGGGKAHALSLAMIGAIHAALKAAADDADVRVIMIHGPGPIFCAGHDLKEINRHSGDADEGRAFLRDLFDACAEMMQAIAGSSKPVIAVVEGIATAAGCQMVASCHMAFAADGARFQLPGVNNGGFCTTPAVAVSRAVPRKHLMELLLSGDTFGTDWAMNAALINRVCPPDQVVAEARAFAAGVAARNPGPIQSGIDTLNAHGGLGLEQAYGMARETMIGHFMDPRRRAIAAASKFAPKG
ncbi:MAG: enoyl-CoA hydratase-related protein [Pseudooceanicola sp.]